MIKIRNNKKYFSLILVIILFFVLSPIFCFARKLETPFPGLEEVRDIKIYFEVIIKSFFTIAGSLAILALILGAIKYITSAGNPEAISDALSRIKASILGLILLLSSIIIMRTINPKLIETNLSPMIDNPGLYLVEKIPSDEKKDIESMKKLNCPSLVEDKNKILKGDYSKINTIYYKCDKSAPSTLNPPKIVWKFKKPNFKDWETAEVVTLDCDKNKSTTLKDFYSFKTEDEVPGIYFYTGKGCSGYRSSVKLVSRDEKGSIIESPFDSNLESIKIIDDPSNRNYYGIVFHSQENAEGKCSDIYFRGDECLDLSGLGKDSGSKKLSAYKSATIFFINHKHLAGDGVKFYSLPHGYTKANAGVYTVDSKIIRPIYTEDPGKMTFKYPPGVDNDEKKSCPTFKDCPWSIEGLGNYLIIIYAITPEDAIIPYCKIFKGGKIANLKGEWIPGAEGKILNKIIIVGSK